MSRRGDAILALLLACLALGSDWLSVRLYDPAVQHLVVSSSELPVHLTAASVGFLNSGPDLNVTLGGTGDLVNATNITEVSFRTERSAQRLPYRHNETLLLERGHELVVERATFNVTKVGEHRGGIAVRYAGGSFVFPVTIRVEAERYLAYLAKSKRNEADLLEDEPRTMRKAAYTYIEAAEHYRLLMNVANEDYCRRQAARILRREVARDESDQRWTDLRALAEQYRAMDDLPELVTVQSALIPWYGDKLSADLTYYEPLAQAFKDVGSLDKAWRTTQLYAEALLRVANSTESLQRRAEGLERAARVFERLCDREGARARYLEAAETYRRALPEGDIPEKDRVLALWSFTIAELYDRSGERVKAEDFYLASLENTLNVIRAREAQNLPLTLKAVRIYARLENEARAGELLDMLAGAQSSPNQTWETSFNVLLGLEDVYRWAWANNSTLLVNKTCAMGRGLAKTLGDQHHLRIYTRCSPPAPEEVCLSSIPVAKELWIDLEAGRLYASLSPTSKSVELVRSLGERVLLLNQSALAEAPAQDRPVLEAVRDVCRQRMASVLQRPFNVSLAAVNGSLVCFASIAGERINGTVVGSTAPPANATAEPRGDPTGAVLRSLLVIVAVFALALALLTYRAPPPASAPRSAREGGERAAGGEAKGRAPVPRAARPPHEGRREARARRAPGLDVEGIDVRLDEEEAEAAGADDERGLPDIPRN